MASGTAAAPVVFRGPCTATPLPSCSGGGGRLVIGSAGTKLVNVRLERLGYFRDGSAGINDDFGALDIEGTAPVTLDGVTISSARNWGIALNNSVGLTPESRGIVIQDVGAQGSASAAAITTSTPATTFTLPRDTIFPATWGNVIRTCGGVHISGTFRAFGSTSYEIVCELSVPSGVTLGAEPGVHFQLGESRNVTFAAGSTVNFDGTAERPITFDTPPGLSVHWGTIEVHSPNVRFNHVVVNNGGYNFQRASILAFERLNLANSTVSNSSTYGLLKRASDTTNYLLGNTFTNNYDGDIGTLP